MKAMLVPSLVSALMSEMKLFLKKYILTKNQHWPAFT